MPLEHQQALVTTTMAAAAANHEHALQLLDSAPTSAKTSNNLATGSDAVVTSSFPAPTMTASTLRSNFVRQMSGPHAASGGSAAPSSKFPDNQNIISSLPLQSPPTAADLQRFYNQPSFSVERRQNHQQQQQSLAKQSVSSYSPGAVDVATGGGGPVRLLTNAVPDTPPAMTTSFGQNPASNVLGPPSRQGPRYTKKAQQQQPAQLIPSQPSATLQQQSAQFQSPSANNDEPSSGQSHTSNNGLSAALHIATKSASGSLSNADDGGRLMAPNEPNNVGGSTPNAAGMQQRPALAVDPDDDEDIIELLSLSSSSGVPSSQQQHAPGLLPATSVNNNNNHLANGPTAGTAGGSNPNVNEQPSGPRDGHTSESNNDGNNQKLPSNGDPVTPTNITAKPTATSRKRKRKDKDEVSLIKTGGGASSGDGFVAAAQPPSSKSKRTTASTSANRQKEITDFFKSPRTGTGASPAKDGLAQQQRSFANNAGGGGSAGGIEILNAPSTSAMPSSSGTIMPSTTQYTGTVTTPTTSGVTPAPSATVGGTQRAGGGGDGRLTLSTSTASSLPNVIPMPFHASSSSSVNSNHNHIMLLNDERDAAFEKLKAEFDVMKSQLDRFKQKSDDKDQRHRRCMEMERRLLIELATNERKAARTKLTHNRMRIGQYVTTREGDAAYVSERFSDGFAFMELKKKNEQILSLKTEIENERKLLAKKKSGSTLKRGQGADGASASGALNASPNALPSSTLPGPSSSAASSTPVVNGVGGGGGGDASTANAAAAAAYAAAQAAAAAADGSNSNSAEEFEQPQSARDFTLQDWYETDEILKLRLANLKKQEAELSEEGEKLERERQLHCRELKRVLSEDHSVFREFPLLKEGRYLLLSLIGRGGFSEVHKAFDFTEQKYVGVKIHQLNREWREEKKANYMRHAQRELTIHRNLKHAKIVELIDFFELDINTLVTVLEYVEGCDLDFYLKQQKTLQEKEARAILIQLMSAIKYFNEIKPPIIHYDLKPGNILMGTGRKYLEIKITDFGLSKIMRDDSMNDDGMDLTSPGAGTYWYLPPEVFETGKVPKVSSKVDVWSIGVIFYQCLYGQKPYGDKLSQRDVLHQRIILNAKEVQFPAKPAVTSEAKHFIRRCLERDPNKRPDAITLANDPYLQSGPRPRASGGGPHTPVASSFY